MLLLEGAYLDLMIGKATALIEKDGLQPGLERGALPIPNQGRNAYRQGDEYACRQDGPPTQASTRKGGIQRAQEKGPARQTRNDEPLPKVNRYLSHI